MKESVFLGESSTKGKIVEVLSGKWPLTARKIYRELLKIHKLSITYQAAHKALKELTDNRILEKRKDGYLINREWVKELGNFSEKVGLELDGLGQDREVKTFQKLAFKTHSDFIRFHVGFIQELVRKEKKVDMIFYFRHIPSPNVLSPDEIKQLKPIFHKIRWKIVSNANTPLDKWNAMYWKKLGIKVYLGKEIPTNSRLIIMNDYIINVFSTKEGNKMWDKVYSVKSVNNANVHEITKGILGKNKTILTIMKDKEIASLFKD